MIHLNFSVSQQERFALGYSIRNSINNDITFLLGVKSTTLSGKDESNVNITFSTILAVIVIHKDPGFHILLCFKHSSK